MCIRDRSTLSKPGKRTKMVDISEGKSSKIEGKIISKRAIKFRWTALILPMFFLSMAFAYIFYMKVYFIPYALLGAALSTAFIYFLAFLAKKLLKPLKIAEEVKLPRKIKESTIIGRFREGVN